MLTKTEIGLYSALIIIAIAILGYTIGPLWLLLLIVPIGLAAL
jgi:hypothetical protein